MKDVLIVVDMQNDFIDGSLGTKEAQAIVGNVKNKIREYLDAGKPVIFTMDTHEENYLDTFEGKHLPVPHCIQKTHGWYVREELAEMLNPETDDFTFITKPTFGSDLLIDALLDTHGESFEFCGLCTDICVISNVLITKAYFDSNEIVVDSSCCAGVTPEKHEAALEVMRSCQVEVL